MNTSKLTLSNETMSELQEIGINPVAKHIDLVISHHERLGEGVIRTICKIENIEVVRIVQAIYGKIVGGKPCWRVRENLVNGEICDFLEHLFLAKAENTLIPFA